MEQEWLVKYQKVDDKRRWGLIASCAFKVHAEVILADCKSRWPEKKFKVSRATKP